jgi:hypothetical protein
MPTATITLVHAHACHFCADAEQALAELGREFPLRVELVTAASVAGQALLSEHRPAMLPLVLVDGVFFSQGRLPRRKLRTHLAAEPVVNRP